MLPPPNPSQKTTCLLYMEAFDIIIPNSRLLTVGSEGKNKYLSEPGHYECNMSSSQGGARLAVQFFFMFLFLNIFLGNCLLSYISYHTKF